LIYGTANLCTILSIAQWLSTVYGKKPVNDVASVQTPINYLAPIRTGG
jgi:hypothetical protein